MAETRKTIAPRDRDPRLLRASRVAARADYQVAGDAWCHLQRLRHTRTMPFSPSSIAYPRTWTPKLRSLPRCSRCPKPQRLGSSTSGRRPDALPARRGPLQLAPRAEKASKYVHIFDQVAAPSEPLQRDMEVIGIAIECFVFWFRCSSRQACTRS
jgi:hypothetical protein